RDRLSGVAAAAHSAWQRTEWSGTGAEQAAAFAAATVAAVDTLAERTDRLRATTRAAGDAVARARARLQEIVDRFESRAAALEPQLDDAQVADALRAEARHALQEALAVVEDLRAELDGQTATLTDLAAAPPSPAVAAGGPAGFGAGFTPPQPGGAPLGTTPGGAGESVALASRAAPAEGALPRPDAAVFGDGVAVRLPDGSTAMAPNGVAADAVRHALTQLGVPYQWGGTTPGVGLDCSGLTQWAYGQAGLNLPRLAQEQDVGAAVDGGALRPGDLAVWDGHVAMVVGDGVMIEAGDPVKLSPVRTTNAGQGFQGFWRPTA
ncbi:glycoside hydrolase, partial [Mycobacterium sp. PS03-16]|uniref:NlpC/P60 family protein n=1 Tax=Mycobacterium sp. PS03-16 TaxID=2559611 RepID=UPI001074586E